MSSINGVKQSELLKYYQMTPDERVAARGVLKKDPNSVHYDESLKTFEKIDKAMIARGLVQDSQKKMSNNFNNNQERKDMSFTPLNAERPRNYGTFQQPSREGQARDVSEMSYGVRVALSAVKEGAKNVASRLAVRGESSVKANKRANEIASGVKPTATSRLQAIRNSVMGK